ncbi:proteasomal ATPase-associated factor 1 isoform X2 [Protopterus annectens]|uniref:proteasomal ATPase-associated factor 1 isoform X2 n=1 Tax=Protopterus annectens TaxID=7888 RepID=UPI001CFAF628|nr:proteasomal ATPase-associated factor 1 isoform X2 [Protopterus annectens]
MAARVFLQSDWFKVLWKNEGEAWISCKIPGKPTLYGSLKCQAVDPDGLPEITASEGFEVLEVTKKSIHVSCPDENTSSKFLAPFTSFSQIHDKSRQLSGHMLEVNCCRFFPSGLVVLSGGIDTLLKIWTVENGSCAATLKGHKGGILDTAVVEKGRHVVSSSRDGTARLWDCLASTCLTVVADCETPVNGIAVGTADSRIDLGSPNQSSSLQEAGTEGKIMLLAREDRTLQGVALQNKSPVFVFNGSSAFNCCTFLSNSYVVAGTQDGDIYYLDMRNTCSPLQTFHRSGAPVLSVIPFKDGFMASQGDGSCFLIQHDLDHVIELTEPDCDPVYKVAIWEKTVYTCCRDGVVRKYLLSEL